MKETYGVKLPELDLHDLVGKLIVWGADRDTAIRRALRALDEMRVDGVATTIPADMAILAHPEFQEAKHSTKWVEEVLDLSEVGATPVPTSDDGDEPKVRRDVDVEVNGKRFSVSVWVPPTAMAGSAGPALPARPRRSAGGGSGMAAAGSGAVTVPMQGTIVAVIVEAGDVVELVILEREVVGLGVDNCRRLDEVRDDLRSDRLGESELSGDGKRLAPSGSNVQQGSLRRHRLDHALHVPAARLAHAVLAVPVGRDVLVHFVLAGVHAATSSGIAQGRGFPSTIEFEPIRPEGALADAGPLELNEYSIEDDWLSLAWDRRGR